MVCINDKEVMLLKEALVSVIMPTYNTPEAFLRMAIESILAQTYQNLEFIIVDDGSTNNDYEIVNSYQDNRIRSYRNEENKGLPYTLNRAMSLAQGDYIARMDSDDVSLPKRLEKMVRFLDIHYCVDIAGSYYREFDHGHRLVGMERSNDLIRPLMLFTNPFCHPSIVFRRSSVEKHKIRYSNEEKAEDYNLWVKCSFNRDINYANVNEILVKYRVHGEQITVKNKKELLRDAMNIRMKILDYLEVELDQEEADIYKKFCLTADYVTEVEFRSIENIFNKIIISNDMKKLYKPEALKKVLANRYKIEFIKRRFFLKQDFRFSYKSSYLRKYAASLLWDGVALMGLNFKNIFTR